MGRTIEPLPLDETFAREYEIEWLRDVPSSPQVRIYGSGPGPILRVTPQGGEPFTIVVPGEAGTMTISTMPNARQFIVFNRREMPVIVDVDKPDTVAAVDHFLGHGLRNVFRLHEAGVIVMNSCCDLIAYGVSGIQWTHSDLFCCDEPIVDVIGDRIIIDCESRQSSGRRRVVIDAKTGALAQIQ